MKVELKQQKERKDREAHCRLICLLYKAFYGHLQAGVRETTAG